MGPSGMDDANSETYFRHQNEMYSRNHINSLETTAKALVKTIAGLEAAAKESQATISIQSSRIAALEVDAARYRELKKHIRTFSLKADGQHVYSASGTLANLRGPTLDAALDAMKGGA